MKWNAVETPRAASVRRQRPSRAVLPYPTCPVTRGRRRRPGDELPDAVELAPAPGPAGEPRSAARAAARKAAPGWGRWAGRPSPPAPCRGRALRRSSASSAPARRSSPSVGPRAVQQARARISTPAPAPSTARKTPIDPARVEVVDGAAADPRLQPAGRDERVARPAGAALRGASAPRAAVGGPAGAGARSPALAELSAP